MVQDEHLVGEGDAHDGAIDAEPAAAGRSGHPRLLDGELVLPVLVVDVHLRALGEKARDEVGARDRPLTSVADAIPELGCVRLRAEPAMPAGLAAAICATPIERGRLSAQ